MVSKCLKIWLKPCWHSLYFRAVPRCFQSWLGASWSAFLLAHDVSSLFLEAIVFCIFQLYLRRLTGLVISMRQTELRWWGSLVASRHLKPLFFVNIFCFWLMLDMSIKKRCRRTVCVASWLAMSLVLSSFSTASASVKFSSFLIDLPLARLVEWKTEAVLHCRRWKVLNCYRFLLFPAFLTFPTVDLKHHATWSLR